MQGRLAQDSPLAADPHQSNRTACNQRAAGRHASRLALALASALAEPQAAAAAPAAALAACRARRGHKWEPRSSLRALARPACALEQAAMALRLAAVAGGAPGVLPRPAPRARHPSPRPLPACTAQAVARAPRRLVCVAAAPGAAAATADGEGNAFAELADAHSRLAGTSAVLVSSGQPVDVTGLWGEGRVALWFGRHMGARAVREARGAPAAAALSHLPRPPPAPFPASTAG